VQFKAFVNYFCR